MNALPSSGHPRLRRFTGSRSVQPDAKRCQVCAVTIPGDHRHLLEIDSGRLQCSCRVCWLLFLNPDAGGGRLRAVPDRVVAMPATRVTAAQWKALQIPIALVFVRRQATGEVTAFYPSPAGATESPLSVEAWADILASNPWLGSAAADVEAVLVRGAPPTQAWYLVPIDACYELIGRIRRRWEGISGGDGVRDEIEQFFASLDEKCAPAAQDRTA